MFAWSVLQLRFSGIRHFPVPIPASPVPFSLAQMSSSKTNKGTITHFFAKAAVVKEEVKKDDSAKRKLVDGEGAGPELAPVFEEKSAEDKHKMRRLVKPSNNEEADDFVDLDDASGTPSDLKELAKTIPHTSSPKTSPRSATLEAKKKESAKIFTDTKPAPEEGPASKKSPRAKSPVSEPHATQKPESSTYAKNDSKPLAENRKMSKIAFDGLMESVKTFDVNKDAMWKKGEPVPFLALAKTFEEIEANSSRLKIVEIAREFYRKVIALTPEDLLPCVYLSTSQVAPSYAGIELGIADATLMSVIAEATGRNVSTLKTMFKDVGDLGKIAQESRLTQKMMLQPKPLTAAGVFKTLKEIATEQGSSSMQKKQDKIKKLFVSARDCEIRYLVRSLGGKLRIGLAEPSVLVALGQAITLTPNQSQHDAGKSMSASELDAALENAVNIVKQVYHEVPCYEQIIPALLAGGVSHLRASCYFTPGVPVKPMLAKPTKGIGEALDRFSDLPFTCEFKYDGERAQIHMLDDGTVRIYSRNSENLTPKYPDIIRLLPKITREGIKSFVLDTEVVAINKESKKLMPFQILSTRARKDVKMEDIKVAVCLYGFDCLYMDGKCLLQEPLRKRREILRESFSEIEHEFRYAQSMDSNDVEEIQHFLHEAISSSCEGLMVKTLDADSTYEPSKRSHKWLKVKKDYLDGLGDSLDLVPIGAYYGKGKRTGVFGAYLLACYDEDNEEYQTICKLGTGFSDEDLEQHANFLKQHMIKSAPSYYQYPDNPALIPDVWFEPCQVWEILAADLSISPQHKAAIGLVDENKGIALRFPRFVRIRTDKNPDDATRNSQVVEMYRKQASASHAMVDDDDD